MLSLAYYANNYASIIDSGLYWGTVCSKNFNKAAADVACKALGFNESIKITPKLVIAYPQVAILSRATLAVH